MDYKEIQDLLKFVSKSDLAEVRIKEGEFEITVRTKNYTKGGAYAGPMPTVMAPPVQSYMSVDSPSSGTSDIESSQGGPKSEAEDSVVGLIEIKSPIVGTFYRSASPDKPPYISIGDSVTKGTVVCIVEAMKLFNEIESEIDGKIVKVMVDDASPVEYDQVLYLVDPRG